MSHCLILAFFVAAAIPAAPAMGYEQHQRVWDYYNTQNERQRFTSDKSCKDSRSEYLAGGPGRRASECEMVTVIVRRR